MLESIDWRRVRQAINQTVRSKERVEEIIPVLSALTEKCGESSRTSKMLIRIGKSLLSSRNCVIIAPCCPDYSHENGTYTFGGLSGGISLLAEIHIEFLRGVQSLVPQARIMLLYADHEADNPELLASTGKTMEEFNSLVVSSIKETYRVVSPMGWEVLPMTKVIPTFIKDEEEISRWIGADPSFGQRLVTETLARSEMYFRIKHRWAEGEMLERTIRTAAQYVALGRYAGENGYLVCNHTTTNLSWYLRTDAGVLHNPVSVY